MVTVSVSYFDLNAGPYGGIPTHTTIDSSKEDDVQNLAQSLEQDDPSFTGDKFLQMIEDAKSSLDKVAEYMSLEMLVTVYAN